MAHPVALSSFEVGSIRLTLVPDGYHRCDPLLSFAGSTADDWHEHRDLLDDRGRLVMTMGALLAELPDGRRVLIDAGFGPRTVILSDMKMEFWGGRMVASLAELGLTPDDIDVVLYSHLHLDHVGWTSQPDGRPTFGRARHVLSQNELTHWTEERRQGGPSEHDVATLRERAELIDVETTVVPGITMVPTPGHTPGHCSFMVQSEKERAVVLGDAIHCPAQISHPEWEFLADADPKAARRSREHLLREIDHPASVVVGPHFTGAVFGRVMAGSVPHQVLFDVAPPAPFQALADEAPAGSFVLPPLD